MKKLSEEKNCGDGNSLQALMKANQIFQNGTMLSQDFTSNIFELHEPKKGGKGKLRYNLPDLNRLKLLKFFRT